MTTPAAAPLAPLNRRLEKARTWLSDHAVPLWSRKGVDWDLGGFVENLSHQGERLDGPKRSMVQARQIYTFRAARDLGVCGAAEAARMVEHSADFLVRYAFLPSGAIAHGMDRNGAIVNAMPDLYGQAFAIFGMANAYVMAPKPAYRDRAEGLVRYLESERRVKAGGFTEVKDGGIQYQSNPHMHLFEAFLAWVEIDPSPRAPWRRLADEVFELCRSKFIDSRTGLLAEHFDEDWQPHRPAGGDGKFVFEPGHQYEWAWLLKWHERLTGQASSELAETLFRHSEAHGISRPRNTTYDEVWSDFTPKKKSARFWPQCERIKAALRLGDARASDEALDALFQYLDAAAPGLWHDTWLEDGRFVDQPVKASSLYHIIGGLGEYLRVRPRI